MSEFDHSSIKLTASFAASSMTKTPSAVVLTSSRDEVNSEQPSGTERSFDCEATSVVF